MTENLQLFLNVMIYFLNFMAVIFLMFAVTLNFNYIEMFSTITDNWRLSPIVDLIVTSNKICPDEYAYMINYNWPGTKDGCDCLNKFNLTGNTDKENKIKQGQCTLTLKEQGCMTIMNTGTVNVNKWNNYTICIKRSGVDYLGLYKNIYKGNCPVNFTNCGEIDSLSNLLCVPNNEGCPYDTRLFKTKLFNNIKEDSFPMRVLIELIVSQGEVCIKNDEMNILTETVYELFNNKKTIKCITHLEYETLVFKYDNRYQKLDSVKTRDYFLQETLIKLYGDLINNTGFSRNYFQFDTSLYTRNFIGWNKNCSFLINNIFSIKDILSQIEKNSNFYLMFSLVILIYCMLFIMILKELLEDIFYFKLGIVLFYNLIVDLVFFLIIREFFWIRYCFDQLNLIIMKGCSDTLTNLLFKYILTSINEIESFYIITIILYISMFMISILMICLTFYKNFKRKLLRFVTAQNYNNTIELALLM